MSAPQRDDAPPVVLIHGVGLDRTMWGGIMHCLSGRLDCTAFDMPCHGEAGMPAGAVTLATFAEALDKVVDSLESAPVVVGFSMGAMVAQRFALDRPEALRGLVLMNAVFDRDRGQRAAIMQRLATVERDGPGGMAESAIQRWFTEGFRKGAPEIVEAVRRRLLANDPAAYLAAYRVFATADGELARKAARISCPTLAMTAEHDMNSTPAMSRELARVIPDAKALVLDGLAHGAPIEAPERVADAICGFISGL